VKPVTIPSAFQNVEDKEKKNVPFVSCMGM
jgi:hypothetical protein